LITYLEKKRFNMTKQELLLYTEEEITYEIASVIKQRRIRLNMTQKELASKANIALPTYIVFEKTGKISLERMLKILRHVNLLGSVVMQILNAESLESLGVDEYIKAKESKEKKRVMHKQKK